MFKRQTKAQPIDQMGEINEISSQDYDDDEFNLLKESGKYKLISFDQFYQF